MTFNGVIQRYKHWFPNDGDPVTLGEGSTPLLHAPRLAETIGLPEGLRLWLKVEALNPTGSFKDRGMTVAVTRARARGARVVVCASTGNTAASAAAYAARAGMLCVVLVPAGGVAAGKFAQVSAHHGLVLEVQGNFDAALASAMELADRRPELQLVNSVNPDRIEGQKTGAFEICDALGYAPAALLLPVGNAGNITAYWRGFKQYREAEIVGDVPRMLGVQAEGAASLVLARDIAEPETVASAIRIGRPASRQGALTAVKESQGAFAAVSDEHLRVARDLLAAEEGVYVELASAAGVAALLANPRWPQEKGVGSGDLVCILTGSGLKEPDQAPQPRVIQVTTDAAQIEDAITSALQE